jgi:hypothetical protein
LLKWQHPDGPDVEKRTVSVPLHDRVRTGTLRSIAEDASAFDETRVREFFDVTDRELRATAGTLEDIVHERVALLVVER